MNLIKLLKSKLSEAVTRSTAKEPSVDRRDFLKGAVGATAAVSSVSCSDLTWESFFQKHYKELVGQEKDRVFQRIENDLSKKHGQKIRLDDPRPQKGVKFVYCLDLGKCNGNRLCVQACAKENNLDASMAYIKVLEMDTGSMNLEKGDQYYDRESVPKDGKFYLPVQCNQCDNPPCVKACPVEATWKEEDGIVVIDYDWCIGCRYCQVACPYEARHFNFKTPKIPADRLNPNQSYLSNRIRPKGVMEKCTFCLHRSRKGDYPACLEACPTGARKFGNI